MMHKMRVKKREVVIPFDGEENFVVPKKGGFGQPDNEHYAMAVGTNTVVVSDAPIDPTNTGTSGTTTVTEPPYTPTNTTTTSTTTTQPAPATPQQLCVAPDLWVNGQCLKGGVEAPPPNSAEATCVNGGGAWINGACVTSTNPRTDVVDTLPNFPVWSSLDCTTLKDKIAEYNAILSTSRFTQEIINSYNTEIAKAQFLYNTKCPAPAPAPSPAPAPITVLPVGGGIGGGIGGGGGFGEPPTDESSTTTTTTVKEKKSNMGLYLILGGLALLYLLTRKKKK